MATALVQRKDWIRVTRDKPCTICGKPDFCTRSADGAVVKCMRIESSQPARGDLGGWIHRVGGAQLRASLPKPAAPQLEQDWSRIALQCFESGAGTRNSLAEELGVSIESLERLMVGKGFDSYRGLYYSTWPELRPGGRVVGIVRRYSVPVSESGGNKLTLPGSKHGLYLPREWWRGSGPVL